MRLVSIFFLLLAVMLITVGRALVRKARRAARASARESVSPPVGTRSAGASRTGWLLTACGFLLMLAGVVIW